MNSLLHYSTFTAVSLSLYILARRIKSSYSGENYTPLKFWLAVSYNMTLCFIHYRFAQTGKLPYIGHTDNSIIGWPSLTLTFLHIFSLPALRPRRWRWRWRFKGKKFDPRLWRISNQNSRSKNQIKSQSSNNEQHLTRPLHYSHLNRPLPSSPLGKICIFRPRLHQSKAMDCDDLQHLFRISPYVFYGKRSHPFLRPYGQRSFRLGVDCDDLATRLRHTDSMESKILAPAYSFWSENPQAQTDIW